MEITTKFSIGDAVCFNEANGEYEHELKKVESNDDQDQVQPQ